MQQAPGRVTNSTSRDIEIIDVDALAMQVVDVDKEYMKYEYNEDEIEIETIDKKTFRESVRRTREHGKDRPSQRDPTPIGARNRVGTVEHPSSIGPTIQNMRMQQQQKRSVSTPQELSITAPSNKRRKIDNSPSPSVGFPSPVPSSKIAMTPNSGPSKHNPATPISHKPAQPNSPDISIVDYVPKVRDSILATFPRPAIPRTQNPNVHANAGSSSSTMNHSIRTGKPTKRTNDVIELSSDGEEVIELLTPKRKKIKRSNSPIHTHSPISIESDDAPEPELESDHEWDWDPPGLDLNNSTRWKAMELNQNKIEDSADNLALEDLHINEATHPPPLPPRYRHPDTSKSVAKHLRRDTSSEFTWDLLGRCSGVYFRHRPRPGALQPSNERPFSLDFHLDRLRSTHSFKEAPGAINRVEQKGRWTAIASSCDGGGPDEENERPSDYNRQGSLITWRDRLDVPEGHRLKKPAYRSGVKHYAVHDVKFDPNSEAFVSSGADRKTRLWTLLDDTDDTDDTNSDDLHGQLPSTSRWKPMLIETYNRPPHELVFHPKTSVLAVAEKKVHLYEVYDGNVRDITTFRLHQLKAPHLIGAMAWGAELTENHLFVSSEPQPSLPPDPLLFEGLHKVYDVASESLLYSLDATEAGDTLALDPIGAVLGLSTRASENRHILRLYDVGRREHKARAEIDLETFPTRLEAEVNCATFSPDGLFIALARTDNQVHVYDVRMLDRGPLFKYEHFGESKAPSQDCVYGVVKAQWLHSAQTRRMALVSGGEDGCVRLWNPLMSSENAMNGTCIAEVNSDIGHFSLGDRFAGEHQLVVGDCAGEVTIFDNIVI